MTKVLIVVGDISETALIRALTDFHDRGAQTSVVCDFDISDLEIDPMLGELHALPTKFTSLSKKAAATKGARRTWLKIREDHWARTRAKHADLIVALDQASIYAVWELAQRYRRPRAIYGLNPSLKALDAGIEPRSESRLNDMVQAVPANGKIVYRLVRNNGVSAGKRAARAVVSPAVMQSGLGSALWTRAVTLPSIPERVRSKVASQVHRNMVEAGRLSNAAQTVTRVARQIGSERRKADLLARAARVEAVVGDPATMQKAIAAELAIADKQFQEKAYRRSAVSLEKAMSLVFLRGLHYDRVETSPLIDQPDEFLATWRRSPAVRALGAPRGRQTPAAPTPTDRPLRLLIATSGNDNFLKEIRERYSNLPGVEARFLNFKDDKIRYALATNRARLIEAKLSGDSAYAASVQEWLGPHIEWADTVFIDWCVAGAAMFSLVDPGTTRIVVRLHSYETFTFWPHLVDFSHIDDLVFVSDHLRDITKVVFPQLETSGTTLHVISNAMELTNYPRAKPSSSRFNLGLIGIGSVAKDPLWAFEVLRELRRRDERYRLILFGETRESEVSEAARRYYQQFETEAAELVASGAVVRLGHVNDVSKALSDVGVILSTSVRESFHCGLVEGAASGAVPLVRNWPFFANTEHGARTLFPTEWVVETPQQAAERILATTQSEEVWRTTGQAASELSIAQWDWTVTQRDFDELFLGDTKTLVADVVRPAPAGGGTDPTAATARVAAP